MKAINSNLVTLASGFRLIIESTPNAMTTKSTKIQKVMKTTFYIIAAILGLQSNLLFATGTSAQTIYSDLMTSYSVIEAVNPVSENNGISLAELKELAPVNPAEAGFSDNDPTTLSVPAPRALAPVTPKEANFDDSDEVMLNSLIYDLAPVLPSEADFPDTDITNGEEAGNLAPVIPFEATFEDVV